MFYCSFKKFYHSFKKLYRSFKQSYRNFAFFQAQSKCACNTEGSFFAISAKRHKYFHFDLILQTRETPHKKIQASPSFSPSNKQKKRFGNYIDVVETKTPYFVLVVLTRANKMSRSTWNPLFPPLKKMTVVILSEQSKVIKIVHTKGNENEDGTYQLKTKSPNSKIPWDRFMAYKTDQKTSHDSIGIHLAK